MRRTGARLRGLLGAVMPQPRARPASPAEQQRHEESILDILESVPVFVKEPAAAAAQRAALHRRVRAAQEAAPAQSRKFITVDHDTDVRTQKSFTAKFLSRETARRLKAEAAAGLTDTRLQCHVLSEAHRFMAEACSEDGTGMAAGPETLAAFLRLSVLVGKGRTAARFAAGPEFPVANAAHIRWNHSVYAQMVAAYSQARMYPELANLYRNKVKTKVRVVEAAYFTALVRAAKRDGALRILEPELSAKHQQSPDGGIAVLPLLLEAVTRSSHLRNEAFGYSSCLAAATSQAQCEGVVRLLLEKGLVALSLRAGSVAAAPAPADAKRSRHVSRVSLDEADLQSMLLKKANRWKLAAWGDRLYNEGVGYLRAGGVPGGMPQPTVEVSRAMLLVHGTFRNFSGLQEVFRHAGDLLATQDRQADRTGILEAYIRGCVLCTTERNDTAHASGKLCFEASLVQDAAAISPLTYRVVCEMAIRYRDTATLTLALNSASQGGLRLLKIYSSLREPVRRLYLETNTTPPPSADVNGKTVIWAP
eukprot:Rhum_TRINITY_DN15771_c0_g1::Rhum_TRINITY_DN15771_c0_g1_i1::g.162060::m.162060